MPYRPPNRPPKGAWARHLHEQRKLRDLSQVAAFELIYERLGLSPKSRTAYIAIDMGDRQPTPAEIAVLGAEFGWPPDVEEPEPLEITEELGELIGVLRRLTDGMATDREEALATREAMMTALADIASRLGPPNTRAAAGRDTDARDR